MLFWTYDRIREKTTMASFFSHFYVSVFSLIRTYVQNNMLMFQTFSHVYVLDICWYKGKREIFSLIPTYIQNSMLMFQSWLCLVFSLILSLFTYTNIRPKQHVNVLVFINEAMVVFYKVTAQLSQAHSIPSSQIPILSK